jgi:uncharacterized membrane protein (DUF485 family)
MKSKFSHFLVNALLSLLLLVATVGTTAKAVFDHTTSLGSTSTEIVSGIGNKSQEIIPLVIDQVIKGSDPKVAETITKNRTQITDAAIKLLNDPKFTSALAGVANTVSLALIAGKNEAIIDPTTLVDTLAKSINDAAGKQIIKGTELKTMATPQKIDLSHQLQVYNNISSALGKVMLVWIVILLLIVVLVLTRKIVAMRIISKILISLGIPMLVLWFILPNIVTSVIKSHADSDLPRLLVPIIYKSVTGFTFSLGIIYILLSGLCYGGYRFFRSKSNQNVSPAE